MTEREKALSAALRQAREALSLLNQAHHEAARTGKVNIDAHNAGIVAGLAADAALKEE